MLLESPTIPSSVSSSKHGVSSAPTPDYNMADCISYCKQQEYPFLTNVSHRPLTSLFQQYILSGSSVALNDKSFFESHNIGSFGWVVTLPNHSQWIIGCNLAPVPRNLTCVFRSKLAGIAAIAAFYHSY